MNSKSDNRPVRPTEEQIVADVGMVRAIHFCKTTILATDHDVVVEVLAHRYSNQGELLEQVHKLVVELQNAVAVSKRAPAWTPCVS